MLIRLKEDLAYLYPLSERFVFCKRSIRTHHTRKGVCLSNGSETGKKSKRILYAYLTGWGHRKVRKYPNYHSYTSFLKKKQISENEKTNNDLADGIPRRFFQGFERLTGDDGPKVGITQAAVHEPYRHQV